MAQEASPQAADIHAQLARVYADEKKYQTAEAHLIRALEIREMFHGTHHTSVANLLYLTGLLAHEKGDFSKAEPLYLQAIKMFKQLGEPAHPASKNAHRFYARLLDDQGRTLEARGWEKKVNELSRR